MADSVLLTYEASLLGNWIPTFRGNLKSYSGIELCNSVWKFRPLKTENSTSCRNVVSHYPDGILSCAAGRTSKHLANCNCMRTMLGILASKICRGRDALYWSVQLYPHVRCNVESFHFACPYATTLATLIRLPNQHCVPEHVQLTVEFVAPYLQLGATDRGCCSNIHTDRQAKYTLLAVGLISYRCERRRVLSG